MDPIEKSYLTIMRLDDNYRPLIDGIEKIMKEFETAGDELFDRFADDLRRMSFLVQRDSGLDKVRQGQNEFLQDILCALEDVPIPARPHRMQQILVQVERILAAN